MSKEARITLPQVLALMAIWTAVIYGLTAAKPATDVEQISLRTQAGVTTCGAGLVKALPSTAHPRESGEPS